MFTRNWYNHIANVISYNTLLNYKTVTGVEYKATSGPQMEIGSTSTNTIGPHMGNPQNSFNGSGGVVFGTGTTAPTVEDYKLSGDLITNLSALANVTVEGDDNGVTITAIYTITNTGADSFTIGEVGIVTNLHYNYFSSNSDSFKGLIERTVLDSPVTIEADGVGQVTYTIRINTHTA